MCGICGQVNADPSRPADRGLLARMAAALRHRGPDSGGFHLSPGVGLAARRLAIIDLATGDQPLSNEDGTVWVAFNGEIYNFRELRTELEQSGHAFRTAGDTEVIVHAYEQYGPEAVGRLNGMFAFALWDARQQRLLLARDRVGKKPLYYFHDPERLIFASEVKALLQDPSLPCTISLPALWHYLTLQYVPDPLCIFEGIRKLPPAHMLVWQAGRIALRGYWDWSFEPKHEADERELTAQVRDTLTRATGDRLVSDVPLGAFLSGGVDSSIVVGLMAQASSRQVKTFSIGFGETSFDELPFARATAAHFRTEHHEFVVRTADALDALPGMASAFDEPLADPSALPVYLLSRLARQHVTVALNGDGGDETFAGYSRYLLDQLVHQYTRLPALVTQGLVPRLLERIPEAGDGPIEFDMVAGLKRLRQVAAITPKASIVRWGSYFSDAMKAELGSPETIAGLGGLSTAALLADCYDRAPARSALDRSLYVDSVTYLPGDLLVKADRMTMAHSLETRSPFLDQRFIELAARLPERHKLRWWTHKALLKLAFADLLPPTVARRGKQGFGLPVGQWLRGPLRPFLHDVLFSSPSNGRGYFRPEAVRRLVEEHGAGKVDHGKRLWALMMLELFHQEYVDGR